ncbi:MAG: excinuclease ABC subunit UvrA [Candidatus Niyogibacteria bacterium]|nr:excinuclease ABC subunit UvrA [Candidatus Niyogibacteria bacterium]
MRRDQSSQNYINIKGAKVHNLKNVSLSIPKNKLVVITGLSGSGKSSLAYDTIYAEAERRFMESVSSYARQFLGVKDRPDVESITGLSPSIAIDQKSIAKNPRSTVGTITETYDFLRVLFARLGTPHCPTCGGSVKKQTAAEMAKRVLAERANELVLILAPLVRGKRGEHRALLEEVAKKGYPRVRIDGGVMKMIEALDLDLDASEKHDIEVIVDRLILDKDTDKKRVLDSLEAALRLGNGFASVVWRKGGIDDGMDIKEVIFSENFSCVKCGSSLPEVEPRLFSFNSPEGACRDCTGIGTKLEVDAALVIPNKNLTLAEGAIQPWSRGARGRGGAGNEDDETSMVAGEKGARRAEKGWNVWMLEDVARRHNFNLHTPVKNMADKALKIVLYGEPGADGSNKKFAGVVHDLERRWRETDSEWLRSELERYMRVRVCPSCRGSRLCPEALAVTLDLGKKRHTIAMLSALPAEEAYEFFSTLAREYAVSKNLAAIAAPLVKEISRRLQFLLNVGLEYLALDRSSTTLSGGEAQRVRLATQLGSDLEGVIYILDEPSVGLHARDHAKLIETLKNLRDSGNSVLVVEHDLATTLAADWVIDVGPGAGEHGGKIIFEGEPSALKSATTSTADYFYGRKKIRVPSLKAPAGKEQFITVLGAQENNLKNITVKIPLGQLVAVSGVSGSGKSTLVNDILARALREKFYGAHSEPGKHRAIKGLENIDKVVVVDQSPIGRTPRSNAATYIGAFSLIRDLYANTHEAKNRNYGVGKFSFNVKGGRCEECEGQGVKQIEMFFLPDIYVECEVCRGARYSKEILDIDWNGRNIAQVLEMSAEEAAKFFHEEPRLEEKLRTLVEVGLGYMKLGQPATTLSGGEAQRVKLAAELSKRDTGRTLYILDEPTTGLHTADIERLLKVLRALTEKGNSVLVIEHNLDVLRNMDWLIDMGPEGGARGGEIIAEGAPAAIAKNKKSLTGQWLAKSNKIL